MTSTVPITAPPPTIPTFTASTTSTSTTATTSSSSSSSSRPTTNTTPTFFQNNSLPSTLYPKVLTLLQTHHPNITITPRPIQGGCSLTLSITSSTSPTTLIAQLRLPRHALDVKLAEQAVEWYGTGFVPRLFWGRTLRFRDGGGEGGRDGETEEFRLQCVVMTCVLGVMAAEVLPRRVELRDCEVERLGGLVLDFAGFLAKGWEVAVERGERMGRRFWTGRVGRTLKGRLARLEVELPGVELRRNAGWVRKIVELGALEELPVVLSHGDLLTTNLMVDAETWRLNGVVDWAEAEMLPFGVALYGLEHLLSFMGGTNGFRVVYYEQELWLRDLFWRALMSHIPALRNESVLRNVSVARDVGVLLWHGFAWDNGKIDRVVNKIDDVEELAMLQAHLNHSRCDSQAML